MRFVPLLMILSLVDAYALTVTDLPPASNRVRESRAMVWIRLSGDNTAEPVRDLPARIVERLDDNWLRIESRQSVVIAGTPRIAVVSAQVCPTDISPDGRISSRNLRQVKVTYTDVPVIPNQRALSRLLSWIF